MKASEGKAIIENCKKRGYVQYGAMLYPPNQAKQLGIETSTNSSGKRKSLKSPVLRSADVNDTRNIRNKSKQTDPFMNLIEIELKLDVWPEFFFSTERQWRFDYAIPEYKIAVECEGGIHTGGRHVRGKGYENDMEKYSFASILGWVLIRRTPSNLTTTDTINLIKKAIENI